MEFFVFLFLFFLQVTSGFPFLLLFLFWQGITSPLPSLLFWSFVVGGSFGSTLGNIPYWIVMAVVTNLVLLFIRQYVVRHPTPIVQFFLFSFLIGAWYALARSFPYQEMLILIFSLSTIFFLTYAFTSKKATYFQRRLFLY